MLHYYLWKLMIYLSCKDASNHLLLQHRVCKFSDIFVDVLANAYMKRIGNYKHVYKLDMHEIYKMKYAFLHFSSIS